MTTSDDELLAERFETHRACLRAVAHRMLGSQGEADDAVQEAWLRLSRADAGGIENQCGWPTRSGAAGSSRGLTSRPARQLISKAPGSRAL